MKILQTVFFAIIMVMATSESYGQSENLRAYLHRKLVISGSNQSDFNSILYPPIESENKKDTIKLKSILPKEFIIDPEFKDFQLGEIIQYAMPIKKLNDNHTIQIYMPDSTVHHTLQIKKMGIEFDEK